MPDRLHSFSVNSRDTAHGILHDNVEHAFAVAHALLRDAAEIDRAGWWRRFRTITFPYIRSLLLLALLFRTIETFKIFDVVYILTEGGPGSSTETVSVYVFRLAFQFFRTSLASALGYIMLFAVIVLTSLYLYAIQTRRAEPVNE